jgi:DNA topoisomerase-2
VIDEKLVVFRKKKADLEAEMATMKFDKVEGTYDYLLNIKTYQYTHEALESLDTETKKLSDDLENLKATGHVDMWKSDLKIYAQ